MIAFVNKGIRNKNEQHLRDYQAVVAENQRLELAYQQEGRLMVIPESSCSNWSRMVP